MRNFEVKYWHKATYDTLTKFACERNFNFVEPELFAGVCNGKLPQIPAHLMVPCDRDVVEERHSMYEDRAKSQLVAGLCEIQLDFEREHRNSSRAFFHRSRAIEWLRRAVGFLRFKLHF